MLCLLCSTLFHTMSCHSEFVSNVFSRLDYAGIALLICGSSITWLYFGFYCEFYYKLTYIISIAVLGILTIVITMMEKFNRPVSNTNYNKLIFSRTKLFLCQYLIIYTSTTCRNTEHSEHHYLLDLELHLHHQSSI